MNYEEERERLIKLIANAMMATQTSRIDKKAKQVVDALEAEGLILTEQDSNE